MKGDKLHYVKELFECTRIKIIRRMEHTSKATELKNKIKHYKILNRAFIKLIKINQN